MRLGALPILGVASGPPPPVLSAAGYSRTATSSPGACSGGARRAEGHSAPPQEQPLAVPTPTTMQGALSGGGVSLPVSLAAAAAATTTTTPRDRYSAAGRTPAPPLVPAMLHLLLLAQGSRINQPWVPWVAACSGSPLQPPTPQPSGSQAPTPPSVPALSGPSAPLPPATATTPSGRRPPRHKIKITITRLGPPAAHSAPVASAWETWEI